MINTAKFLTETSSLSHQHQSFFGFPSERVMLIPSGRNYGNELALWPTASRHRLTVHMQRLPLEIGTNPKKATYCSTYLHHFFKYKQSVNTVQCNSRL